MAKEGSVAPKERVNIKYIPATGDAQTEVELPLKVLVVGDFKGQKEEAPLEERMSVNVNKNNFKSVFKESNLVLSATVPNKLVEEENVDLPISLSFEKLEDFSPDSITQNVPELNKLIELRDTLLALKGPLGNVPAFRSRLQELLSSEQSRNQLLMELDLTEKQK